MKRLILIAAASLALAGCGKTLAVARPSDVYLACAPEPDVPGDAVTGVVTDEQDAAYKSGLRAAGQDCRSKVDYLHDWFSKLPR